MKIGIIVYSQTGNTSLVAHKIKEKLIEVEHVVNIELIKASGDIHPGLTNVRLDNPPDISSYDAVIIAAGVMAFSMSPVIAAFINQTVSLKNKKVACFVTHFFPFTGMGGSQAVAQMKDACEKKGASVIGTGVISWSGFSRALKINELAGTFSSLFK